MTPDATHLAENHVGLVWSIARGERGRLGGDTDELVGDGMVGLVRAADRFDPSRWRGEFRYFARPMIVQAMIDGFRQRTHFNRRLGHGKYEMVSFIPFESDEDKTVDLFPPSMSAEDAAIANIEAARLLELLAAMPTPLRDVAAVAIAQDGAGHGDGYGRLAAEQGVTASRISQRMADVRRRVAAAVA